MTARIIPFPDKSRAEVEGIIDRARLRRADKVIAREAIIYLSDFVDIGAMDEVRLSRSGVGKRYRNEILPELKRVAGE